MNEQTERVEDVAAVNVGATVVEPSAQAEEIRVEEFKISGDALVAKVKELLRQGNVRYIIIKNGAGRTLVEVPLTVGVVGGIAGAFFLPFIAAIAAIGVLAARLTIVIARKE